MKIELNENTVVEDAKDNLIRKDDGVVCGCGIRSLKSLSFIDGTDFYIQNYACECGNIIKVTGKKQEDDLLYGDFGEEE